MVEQEVDQYMNYIADAVQHSRTNELIGVIAETLVRIAAAQEALVALADQDLNEQVEAMAENKAVEKAHQLDEDKTRRSFIGKKL